jgi:hypothetical protein
LAVRFFPALSASVLLGVAILSCDRPRFGVAEAQDASTRGGSVRDSVPSGPSFTVIYARNRQTIAARVAAASNSSPDDTARPLRDSAGADTTATDTAARPARMSFEDSVLAHWPEILPAEDGALFPKYRVVAYYGNPLSKRMGILGEIAPEKMLAKLEETAQEYADADPSTPVVPALELVAIVAQASPGKNGLYRMRMADTLIKKVIGWAESKRYIVILDIQTGLSNVAAELPSLLPYLAMPNVHLALDPEFSMKKSGKPPGKKIGSMDAAEINGAIETLDSLSRAHNLPPKFLLVHRFTRDMVSNSSNIKPTSRVQVVMDMDGFGAPWLKRGSWKAYIQKYPVQYTGLKLFYKNDKPLFKPEEVVGFKPSPLFVMYQ